MSAQFEENSFKETYKIFPSPYFFEKQNYLINEIIFSLWEASENNDDSEITFKVIRKLGDDILHSVNIL